MRPPSVPTVPAGLAGVMLLESVMLRQSTGVLGVPDEVPGTSVMLIACTRPISAEYGPSVSGMKLIVPRSPGGAACVIMAMLKMPMSVGWGVVRSHCGATGSPPCWPTWVSSWRSSAPPLWVSGA